MYLSNLTSEISKSVFGPDMIGYLIVRSGGCVGCEILKRLWTEEILTEVRVAVTALV
jgi:hypothetical protein